jgi:hypothetical protein
MSTICLDLCTEARPHIRCILKKIRSRGERFSGAFRVKRLDVIQSVLRTSEYIDNNPVKAGLVRRSEDYKWLSGSFGKEEEAYYLL